MENRSWHFVGNIVAGVVSDVLFCFLSSERCCWESQPILINGSSVFIFADRSLDDIFETFIRGKVFVFDEVSWEMYPTTICEMPNHLSTNIKECDRFVSDQP